MGSRWTDETLAAARAEGDKEVDELVADILTQSSDPAKFGRLGYNALLDVADLLIEMPELLLAKDSMLHQELKDLEAGNARVVGFFHPLEAPDWVDEAKLDRAAELWETDTLLSIAVLYAASLPACYLMQKGVPSLYDTGKLAKHDYVFQRIYETGLMLDAVLDPGGIKVLHDVSHGSVVHLRHVLHRFDPTGHWEWRGHRLERSSGAADTCVDPERLHREFEEACRKPKRYLWGKGCVSAKKVRFLHASMRAMLMHPERFAPVGDVEKPQAMGEHLTHRQVPWNVSELGVPINQEDQAFVLLTFGYLIPKGMERWGRTVPREQKEAFLHLWKVIGYIMGIRVDLMTDNLDEAEALYEQILRRNAHESPYGQLLTDAVMEFLEEYLPARFGLARRFPAALIIDQLGPERARMIVREERFRAARGLLSRLGYNACKLGVWIYYRLRDRILVHIPLVASSMKILLHRSAEMLIESWRDAFRRKPFYLPADATTWVRVHGVTPEYRQRLKAWRVSMFDTLLVAVASIIIAGFAVGAAVGFAIFAMWMPVAVAAAVSVAGAAVAAFIMRWTLPAVFNRRPTIKDELSGEYGAGPEADKVAA